MIDNRHGRRLQGSRVHFLGLLIFGIVLALYPLIRYGGYWGEVDTAVFSFYSKAIFDRGALIGSGANYPHGYAYPALIASLSHTTGIEASRLNVLSASLLFPWLIVPAWLLYRDLTGRARIATLATLILLIQPEFLFPVTRGTHEKFTRGLMLLSLFLIIRAIRTRHNLRAFASFILAFCLIVYGFLALNIALGISSLVAIGLALALIWLGSRFRPPGGLALTPVFGRLSFALIVSLILAFLLLFFIYPPSSNFLRLMESTGEQMASLLLDVETTAQTGKVYSAVSYGWLNRQVYFILSLANWLLIGAAGLIWITQSLKWLFGRWRPESFGRLIMWAFVGAYAILGALSVIADLSGTFAGNLQLRSFPAFVLLAAPIIASWLIEMPGHNKPILRGIIVFIFGILAILSILKYTNEPLLANLWLGHAPAEMQAIQWADEKLANRDLWAGYDERLTSAAIIQTVGSPLEYDLDDRSPDPGVQDFLISELTRFRSRRLRTSLPVEFDSFVTYDNGQAQIRHHRPESPFQR